MGEAFGMWGGLSPRERQQLRRRHERERQALRRHQDHEEHQLEQDLLEERRPA